MTTVPGHRLVRSYHSVLLDSVRARFETLGRGAAVADRSFDFHDYLSQLALVPTSVMLNNSARPKQSLGEKRSSADGRPFSLTSHLC
jgi:hypothetical protein